MAQTLALSGHHCCRPGTPFTSSITLKFDMIIQVSLRLRASSLQVEFPKHFTLSDIGKTLLIMVGKCKGFNMNVLSIKVWSCHFACDLNIQVKIVVVTKV